MRNGSERTTLPTGRSADPVKLAVVTVPIATFLTFFSHASSSRRSPRYFNRGNILGAMFLIVVDLSVDNRPGGATM